MKVTIHTTNEQSNHHGKKNANCQTLQRKKLTFLQTIENFRQAFSEEDEDEKSVITSLDHVAAKLAEVQGSALFPDDLWHSVMCLQ